MALDLQPIPDSSTPQQPQVPPTPAPTNVPQSSTPAAAPGNSGKLDLQPILDLQPLDPSPSNDQSNITPFEQGMTKQLYNNVPFGKDIIKGTDALAGTHMASDIENNTPPNTIGEKVGEAVGGSLSLFPAWEAGGALAPGVSPLLAGSAGVGVQGDVESLNKGKSPQEALGAGALDAGGTFVGGKAIEGLGNVISPMLQGLAGHGDVYRNLLNPGKGVVNDIEVKSGKDINDAFQTMANERLPIKSVIQNNRDTIDTNEARAVIKGRISGLYDQLQNTLQNSDAKFNLNDLRDQVLAKLRPAFKNDEDFEGAQQDVNNQFDAAIRQRVPAYEEGQLFDDKGNATPGDPMVDAPTLSNMKEGMWQKGYNLLAPNSQKTARIIGNTLKQAIEDAHPDDSNIKELNQEMGNLQTVDGILQKTHGKVVNGGALGNYLRGGVGAIVGEQIGQLLGHPVIGTGLGGFVGEQTNRLFNNPELITAALSKIRDIHDFGGTMADGAADLALKFGLKPKAPVTPPDNAITPEVMGGKGELPYLPKIGLNRALPSPKDAGQSSGPVITPEAQEGQVMPQSKLLPAPDTVYGPGFTMKDYKPQPVNLSDGDRKDLEDMLDWTSNQQKGERYSFINAEGQRQYSGTPSAHAQSVQEIGPKPAQEMMTKALLNKPMTPMQTLKVKKMLTDFQTNIKPKMNGIIPGAEASDGQVEGNTGANKTDNPSGPDLGGNKGSVDIGGKNAPTFYSEASNVIDQKMPNAATPEQVRGILSPANGVKPDELKWMGLDDYLSGKTKVSKADLQNFIKDNQVQVNEVEKSDQIANPEHDKLHRGYMAAQETRASIGQKLGSDPYVSGQPFRWMYKDATGKPVDVPVQYHDALDKATEAENAYDNISNQDERNRPEGSPQFGQYQLPGGQNYREMLLTLPESKNAVTDKNALKDVNDFKNQMAKKYGMNWKEKASPAELKKNTDLSYASARAAVKSGQDTFRDSHFDEPNVLAHVRMNDRVDADGKKNLFLEEVQSDWHQKGKQLGYRGTSDLSPQQLNARVLELENKGTDATPVEKQEWAKLKSIQENKGVPDAPFQKTWHELAMKRMLRYAAENGYDRLSWTTGDQQAERYDLSKHIDSISYSRPIINGQVTKQDLFNISALKGKDVVLKKDEQTPQQLEALIGKDATKKIVDQKSHIGVIDGDDLKVGGEGMKGFYDKILPDFMNKYAKKWGGEVKDTKLTTEKSIKDHPTVNSFEDGLKYLKSGKGQIWYEISDEPGQYSSYEDPGDWKETFEKGDDFSEMHKVPEGEDFSTIERHAHSIDITPAMKQSVMKQGQPLFNWNPTTATGAAGLGLGAALGAKKATAGQPGAQDRLNLPAPQYTKREEGFRGSIYQDTSGHKSIGYGFNLDDPSMRRMISNDVLNGKRELTNREADSIFSKAFAKAQDDATRFVGPSTWGKLSTSQQKALTDMSYNLGLNKLNGFKNMRSALQAGDYNKASGEVLKSNYASEVPNRAKRNSQLLKSNV